jgi:probable F420-dependent oxidoreductase
MKIDAPFGMEFSLDTAAGTARAAEAAGYDGLWSLEAAHDPFLPLLLAAEHTERLELGTGIAVAFARTPMTLAYLADDLQRYARGRFVLGLGSQIKPHIERRFSMPWSNPAARMRELVLAIRAIWRSWETGERLDFAGEFYTHTLMTPFFSPGPNPHGTPRIFVAAVGPRMTGVAAEVADGLLVHGFTTARYLRERTIPLLDQGLAEAGRRRADVTVSYPGFVATGTTRDRVEAARTAIRGHLAFYGSTPAYRPVLDLHGWGDLADELHTLSRRNEPAAWQQMADLVTDDVLDAFAVSGEPDAIAPQIRERFAGLVDRFSFYTPYDTEPDVLASIVRDLRAPRDPGVSRPPG